MTLAEKINRDHRLETGRLLLEAKARVPARCRLGWMKRNFEGD